MFKHGSTGCIYRPPLRCKDNMDIDAHVLTEGVYENKLSKSMKTYDATQEQKQNQRMDHIDPNEEFHYKGTIQCKIDTTHADTKTRSYACRDSTNKTDQ